MKLLVQDLKQVRWECLHFVESGDEVGLLTNAGDGKVAVFEVNGACIESERDLLSALARAMEFPSYFGMNWDALDECLRDLSWRPAKGYVLVLRDAEQLWRRNGRLMGSLVGSWLFAAESWAKASVSFHLLFVW
jgi:RNAse (barnase) inhibitor barstar